VLNKYFLLLKTVEQHIICVETVMYVFAWFIDEYKCQKDSIYLKFEIFCNIMGHILTIWNASIKSKTQVTLWADHTQIYNGLVWSSYITHRCGLSITWNKPIRASSHISFKTSFKSMFACSMTDCYYNGGFA